MAEFRWANGHVTRAAIEGDDMALPANWTQYPPYSWYRVITGPAEVLRHSRDVNTFDAGYKTLGGITFELYVLAMTGEQFAYFKSLRFPTNGRYEEATLLVRETLAGGAWIAVNGRVILPARPPMKLGKIVDLSIRFVNGRIAEDGD